MVERINRPQRKLDVPFRIDIVRHPQSHLANVLHIAILVNDEMHLVNIACPSAQMPFITLRACPAYDFRIETIIRL